MIFNSPTAVPIALTELWDLYTVVAGVNGWIDTDISASIGARSLTVLILINLTCVAGDGTIYAGARAHGSALGKVNQVDEGVTLQCFTVVKSDAAGHVDLYRNAKRNANYTVAGYWS